MISSRANCVYSYHRDSVPFPFSFCVLYCDHALFRLPPTSILFFSCNHLCAWPFGIALIFVLFAITCSPTHTVDGLLLCLNAHQVNQANAIARGGDLAKAAEMLRSVERQWSDASVRRFVRERQRQTERKSARERERTCVDV